MSGSVTHVAVDEGAPTRPVGPVGRAIRSVIVFYQHAVDGRPSPCRFTPTCSSYALEAIETHGALRGTWLAIRRLARCHPFGGHGFDPVPLPKG